MTNTDSRIAFGLEELAPWDDTDALENHDARSKEADMRELAAYDFDSDNRTLVGLGPVERARLAREAAEVSASQRMPQSEPPGPFIADGGDDDDDELVRSLRRPRLGRWAIAAPVALVVTATVVAVVRGLAPAAPPASQPAVAAHSPEATPKPEPKLEAVSAQPSPTEGVDPNERAETEPLPERPEAPPPSSTVKAPSAAVLPVTLPEQPPLAVAATSPVAAGASVGSLNVTSSPPANVLLDGRPLGTAPRLVQVPPGRHTVLFIHPLYGRRSVSVNVRAGQTTSASADF